MRGTSAREQKYSKPPQEHTLNLCSSNHPSSKLPTLPISCTRKLFWLPPSIFVSPNYYSLCNQSHLAQNLPLPLKITQKIHLLRIHQKYTPNSCPPTCAYQKNFYKQQLGSLGYNNCLSYISFFSL